MTRDTFPARLGRECAALKEFHERGERFLECALALVLEREGVPLLLEDLRGHDDAEAEGHLHDPRPLFAFDTI